MSFKRSAPFLCCLAIGPLAAAWWGASVPGAAAEQDQGEKPAGLSAKRRDAAKLFYEGLSRDMKTALRPRFMDDVTTLCQWSQRWLDADRAVAKGKAEQVAAYAAHLERVNSLEKLCQIQFKGGAIAKYELAAVQYFRIEVEEWLAKAKGQ